MIEKMRKLNLAALSYDRDGILNALQRTNAVEVKEHCAVEGAAPVPAFGDGLGEYLASLEGALKTLQDLKGGKEREVVTSYEEFMSAGRLKSEAEEIAAKIDELTAKKSELSAKRGQIAREEEALAPYAAAALPFDAYSDTAHTRTFFGTVLNTAFENIKKSLDVLTLADYQTARAGDVVLIVLSVHRSGGDEAAEILNSAGFTPCPFKGGDSAAERLAALKSELDRVESGQKQADDELYALTENIEKLKIYCDFVGFELEKQSACEKTCATERTFLLEAFVPEVMEEAVKKALDDSGYTLFYEFSDPAPDEEVPTLLKNNPVVKNFESITNMYSVPSPREFDPNTVMAFFYSLFLGFIMGDIGYGAVMVIAGGLLYFKSRAGSGLKNLSGVFAVGGVFAIIWGVLFNSLFGCAVLPFTVMPDPQKGRYTLAGIQIPAMLVIAMLVGIVHLMTGYICRAVKEWRDKHIADGILDGVVWAVFSLGVAVALIALVEEFKLPKTLAYIGGGVAGVCLLIAALTAGRKEKIIGKFTKGFGSLYGVINYVSDVLSYARLYGLMLSGAVIAQIISDYAIDFITTSVPLAILGVILMVVGHVFNLAMGLLGAYIHDARLQYVEFYGRFYTGEGELFSPLGSNRKYICLEEKK